MKKTIYQVLLLFVFSFNSSSVQAATFAHVREDVDTTIVYDEGREVIYLDAKRLRRGGRARK